MIPDMPEAANGRLAAEGSKPERDESLSPWVLLMQGMIAGAALVVVGAALINLYLF